MIQPAIRFRTKGVIEIDTPHRLPSAGTGCPDQKISRRQALLREAASMPVHGEDERAVPPLCHRYVKPLECGGADLPGNMQWQTVEAGKAKDKTERNCRL
jgi:hypothetical protein